MRGLFLKKKKNHSYLKPRGTTERWDREKRGRGRDSLAKRSFVLLPVKHFTVCASRFCGRLLYRSQTFSFVWYGAAFYIFIYNEQGCVVSLLGPFGWLKAHCVRWMSVCSQFGFLPTTPSITRLFGLLKVWVDKGDVFLLLLDWALPDLKREVEYSGSSHVPTPLGLAKKDKTLSLYPSTPQAWPHQIFMGHSRLLSKLANLLRKTCVKIGWADMTLPPLPRKSPDGKGVVGCHFGSPVSIVTSRRRVARGGLSEGNGPGVECEGGGGLDKRGQEKPSFIRMGIERWLGTMKDWRAAMFEWQKAWSDVLIGRDGLGFGHSFPALCWNFSWKSYIFNLSLKVYITKLPFL